MSISPDQWVMFIISALTLIFGSGLYFRFKGKKKIEATSVDISESKKKEIGNSLRKTIKVKIGDFVTLSWRNKDIKISVIDIVQETFDTKHFKSEGYGAELEVSTGGGLVYGGYSAKETGVNRYKIPVKKFQDEEVYSIFQFHGNDKYFSFLRIYIEHINPHANEVTLNIFCFSS